MDDKKLASSDYENKGQETPSDMTPAEAPSLIETPSGRPTADGKTPKSQALLDIEADAAEGSGPESKKYASSKTAPQNLASIARFRWIILLVLSLASLVIWTAEAQLSDRPYKLVALGYLVVSLILTIPTMKFLRVPTRGALAALLWAGTFLISAFQGPDETLFGKIPAALPWGGLLVLILIWAAVAVWRKVGRYKVIDIILGLIILYAALSPLLALVDNITAGNVLSLKFQTLNASPAFITRHLPWFMWPMTVVLALVLPLCAIFALWDQCSVLKRRGARHGGDFFLALAFLLIIPYGFLSYDKAVSEMPEIARDIRAINPLVSVSPASELNIAAPAPVPAPETIEETAPPAEQPAEPTAPAVPEVEAPAPTAESPESPAPSIPEAAPALPADGPEAVDRTAELENELNAAKDRINTLENRLERLHSDLEQLKRGLPPIPAPPEEPPAPLERTEEPGLPSTTT